MNVLIKYNAVNILSFGASPETGVAAAVLKPGLNEIEAEVWAKNKSHPVLKVLVEEGKIEVLSEEPKEKQVVVLTKMKPTEALATIKETIDLPLLEGWLKSEKRVNVLKALREQIAELQAPPVYRDKTAQE